MPGRIKTPLISLRFRATTPLPIIREARRRYSKYLEDEDKAEDWFQSDLHKKISASMSPSIWLKRLREAHGLTQEELGKKIGKVSDKRISDWESGRRSIPKSAARAFSKWFGVPPDKFL
jgi:DNA-binding XRE family transcriptional regulator